MTPWTWREFHQAMKAAGWQRRERNDPAKVYVHSETGKEFQPYEFAVIGDDTLSVAWMYWAVERTTPPPF